MPNIDQEIQSAEMKLGFKIPPIYQDFLKTRASELSTITVEINGQPSNWFDRVLALTPEELVSANVYAYEAFVSACELPTWWQSYFSFGDDGGDGFYFMKRDGSPEVYFVDDYDDKLTLNQPSLNAFIEEQLQDRERFIKNE